VQQFTKAVSLSNECSLKIWRCVNVKGYFFEWSETVAVYVRLLSATQCKVTGMFVNLIPPVTVTFDDLFHFDFTVKSRRTNAYYFLRIEVVAFDLQQPEVYGVFHLLVLLNCLISSSLRSGSRNIRDIPVYNARPVVRIAYY